jgi:hypothetical protein
MGTVMVDASAICWYPVQVNVCALANKERTIRMIVVKILIGIFFWILNIWKILMPERWGGKLILGMRDAG